MSLIEEALELRFKRIEDFMNRWQKHHVELEVRVQKLGKKAVHAGEMRPEEEARIMQGVFDQLKTLSAKVGYMQVQMMALHKAVTDKKKADPLEGDHGVHINLDLDDAMDERFFKISVAFDQFSHRLIAIEKAHGIH